MRKLPEIKARPRAAQIFAVIIAGIIAVSTVLTFGVIYVLLKLKIDTISAVVTSTSDGGKLAALVIGLAASSLPSRWLRLSRRRLTTVYEGLWIPY